MRLIPLCSSQFLTLTFLFHISLQEQKFLEMCLHPESTPWVPLYLETTIHLCIPPFSFLPFHRIIPPSTFTSLHTCMQSLCSSQASNALSNTPYYTQKQDDLTWALGSVSAPTMRQCSRNFSMVCFIISHVILDWIFTSGWMLTLSISRTTAVNSSTNRGGWNKCKIIID